MTQTLRVVSYNEHYPAAVCPLIGCTVTTVHGHGTDATYAPRPR